MVNQFHGCSCVSAVVDNSLVGFSSILLVVSVVVGLSGAVGGSVAVIASADIGGSGFLVFISKTEIKELV